VWFFFSVVPQTLLKALITPEALLLLYLSSFLAALVQLQLSYALEKKKEVV